MEPMNVNQGDDSQFGGSWTSTVGTTFNASDLLRQRFEDALLDPGSLGSRGITAGVGDLDLHLLLLVVKKGEEFGLALLSFEIKIMRCNGSCHPFYFSAVRSS